MAEVEAESNIESEMNVYADDETGKQHKLCVDSTERQYASVVSQDQNSNSFGSDNDIIELEEGHSSCEMKQLQASINSHEHEQVVAFKDLEFSDPAHWPRVLSDDHTKFIVEKGPCHIKNYDYPTDKNGRWFLE